MFDIDKERLKKSLFLMGYFWDKTKPNLQNVRQEDLPKLDIEHPLVKDATAGWQGFDANFDALAFIAHLRGIIADGEPGPVTSFMLDVPRCPLPDFAPPPNASFHYDDPAIQNAVESMQRAEAMGSGSWPSCDPERQDVNSFRVRLDPANMPSTVRGYYVQALASVVAAYAEMGCSLRYILASTGGCEIAKRFESLAGSVIGWNEFPSPGTCDQTIDGRLDTGYAPSDYRYWANLECHETGHGVGLSHTSGSIMNPSILLVWPLTWKGSPSESSMRRYFGGIAIPTTPTPDPTPTPIPTPGDHNGVFVFQGKLFKIKVFE